LSPQAFPPKGVLAVQADKDALRTEVQRLRAEMGIVTRERDALCRQVHDLGEQLAVMLRKLEAVETLRGAYSNIVGPRSILKLTLKP
jgi:uncharacterized coiled-coil DUF342 family protein